MSTKIRRVEYFYTTVKDEPGEAYHLLSLLSDLGVNLLAFTSVPVGPMHTQLTLFPEESAILVSESKKAQLSLGGPHPAFLVQGDDRLGVLTDIHVKLFEADINVYASNGVTDGRGSFGYILYVRSDQFDRAARVLGI